MIYVSFASKIICVASKIICVEMTDEGIDKDNFCIQPRFHADLKNVVVQLRKVSIQTIKASDTPLLTI